MKQCFSVGWAWLVCGVSVAVLTPWAGAWTTQVADARYQESGYGLSFAPPADGTLDPQPADGAVVVWDLGDRASLRLKIKRWHFALESIETTMGMMWKESNLGFSAAQPTELLAERRRIADRPAYVQIATLQSQPPLYLPEHEKARFDTRPLFYGQAAIQIDPYSAAIFELYAPHERADDATALLENIVASAELAVPETLYELRKEQFKAAKTWLDATDLPALAREQPDDVWFEISLADRAVGYARQRWWTDPAQVQRQNVALKQPGFVAATYSLVRRGNTELVTRRDAYLMEGQAQEVWSHASSFTVTRAQAGGLFADERTTSEWSETGVRNGDAIELAFKVPPDADTVRSVMEAEQVRARMGVGVVIDDLPMFTRREAFSYIPTRLPASLLDGEPAIPPIDVLLSQAVLPLMPLALPKDRPASFAFYAYDSDAGRLALRTYDVVPDDRGVVVRLRATPWSPVTVHRFDARGRLQEVIYPGGMRWRPSTKALLATVFDELR